MTRNTGLTLAQILAELPNAVSCSGGCREPGDGYPRGMLVNEIGQIFEAGGIEGNKAEDELAKLGLGDVSVHALAPGESL